MPRKKLLRAPDWYPDAAEIMVRNEVSLSDAVAELEIDLDPEEIFIVSGRKEFQQALREAQNKYFSNLAEQPGRSKTSTIGKMELITEKLMKEGKWEQAAAVAEKQAKLEGWVGADSNINVFAGLSSRDIEREKERILKELDKSTGNTKETLSN